MPAEGALVPIGDELEVSEVIVGGGTLRYQFEHRPGHIARAVTRGALGGRDARRWRCSNGTYGAAPAVAVGRLQVVTGQRRPVETDRHRAVAVHRDLALVLHARQLEGLRGAVEAAVAMGPGMSDRWIRRRQTAISSK